jgi:NADH-quinone oxidoreductase subunit E
MRLVADMLSMAYIRVYEVATFYTMFQLSPVGRKAHVQVCGTTPCMLGGSEALLDVCRRRIHPEPHHLSKDGDFSWEEVECMGTCANAPMVQVGKDTYEDLTPQQFERVLDGFAAGKPLPPGSQIGRQASCPAGGPTTLKDFAAPANMSGGAHNMAMDTAKDAAKDTARDNAKDQARDKASN